MQPQPRGNPMNENRLYHYRAQVVSVYDGDTVRADIDLGLSIFVRDEPLRLSRINAPEIRGSERPAGLLARDYLARRIQGREVLLQTEKDNKEKYGRYLAEIWLPEDGGYVNINDELVARGLAEYRDY